MLPSAQAERQDSSDAELPPGDRRGFGVGRNELHLIQTTPNGSGMDLRFRPGVPGALEHKLPYMFCKNDIQLAGIGDRKRLSPQMTK